MKILAVDDSGIMRKIIQGIVISLGYDMLEAADGAEAMAILEDRYSEIVLVLLDVNMPVKDGLTTLKEIKSDDRFKHIPVMMITTESEKEVIIQAIQSGAKHYMTKPFSPQDLSTRLLECLGQGVF